MTEEFNEKEENEMMEPVSSMDEEQSRPLPYAQDPDYKDLLHHYQNADWDASLAAVEKLLQTYPEEPGLLEFQHELQMRNNLLHLSLQAEDEDKRERRKEIGKKVLIGVVAFVVVFSLAFAGITWYQNSREAAAAERARIEFEQELASKYEVAQSYFNGGRAADALEKFQEIEALSPGYKDVPEKIAASEALVALNEKYQDARRLYQDGNLEEALQLFREIVAEDPKYNDASLLVTEIENTLKVNDLMQVAADAYAQEDWLKVVETKDQILEIDANADISSLDVALFNSYLNLVIETASKPDVTPEEVDKAYEYYRAGLAIFPQDKDFETERAELQRVAISLLANKYLLYAKDLVETENYSQQAVEQALTFLNRANNIGSGTPAITSEITVLQQYLSALEDFNNYRWDSAITNLEQLKRSDENYANGMVSYLLYEAYLARGVALSDFGEYSTARTDFEQAEILARGNYGNLLRLFAVEIQIGSNLRRLSLTQLSAEYFRFAANQVNFVRKLGNDFPEKADTFAEAEADYLDGDYWNASRLYELALEDTSMLYNYSTVTIARGDMIAQVAFQNGSSIGAILQFNPQLGDNLVARSEMEIQVPVLPEDQN